MNPTGWARASRIPADVRWAAVGELGALKAEGLEE